MKIGFIGLGAMGSGMAANLAKSDYKICAFDLNPLALEVARTNGCEVADSLQSACKGAEIIISMLPNGAIVKEIYGGDDGVFDNVPNNALLIDCSTISVEDARYICESADKRGLSMIDAPVSGGVGAADAGTLTFMVGGPKSLFDRAEPILALMGKAIIYAGGSGNGQAAKICNNMLLAVSMAGVAEAFVLAERLGLDAKSFFDIASKSSGQCWSLTSYAPVKGLVPTAPSNRDFENGFAVGLMNKDIGLALEAANSAQFTPTMALKAKEIYSKYEVNTNKGKDFSGIINMLRQS